MRVAAATDAPRYKRNAKINVRQYLRQQLGERIHVA